jgi:ligand-binding sensor domain-containing protein
MQIMAICVVFGQPLMNKVKFSRIDVLSGLSHSNVICILQDSKGFMWIGTGDGLDKFDGYHFEAYKNIDGDSTTIYRNSVTSLYEDQFGTLWVLTRGGGVQYYDRKKNNFRRLDDLKGDFVRFYEDDDRNVWILGARNEHTVAGKLDVLKKEIFFYNAFEGSSPMTTMMQESQDEYWFGVRDDGLYKWNIKTHEVKRCIPEGSKYQLAGKEIVEIIRDKKGNLWIATRTGLSKYNIDSGVITNFKHTVGCSNCLPLDVIRDISLDKNVLWIATENGGLAKLNTLDNQFDVYKNNKNDLTSLSDNSVWSVYNDPQGRLWVGTFSRGLCVIDPLREKFLELDVELENDVVNAILYDSKQRLWVGTEGGLVLKENQKVTLFKHTTDPNSLGNDPVLSIFEDSNHQIWVGTWAGGLNLFNEKQRNFKRFLPSKDSTSLSNPHVYSISETKETHQLLVSSYYGLNITDSRNPGRFKRIIDERTANNYVRVIFQDSQDNTWVGSISEFDRLDIKTGKRKRYFLNNDSTSYDAITNCVTEDKLGRLWVGTEHGLYLLVNKKLTARFTESEGLPSNIINGILEDKDGTLWLSTSNGMSHFNPAKKTFENYFVSDGLLSNEFKPNACFKSSGGLFLFGGKGVNVFNPSAITRNPHVPNVYLTDLKIFNHSVEIGSPDSILCQHISEVKEINIPEELNFFSIDFVALNFSVHEKNQYAYLLEGFDKDWVMLDNKRSATFTNLDPGTYTFKVKASNNDGLWNESGTSLVINILPPWYRTIWFKVTASFMVSFSAIAFYKIRMSQVERRNEKLESIITDRTKELKEVNQELKFREVRISMQNDELIAQQEELENQNKKLMRQSQELKQQNDAILSSKKQQLDLFKQKLVEKAEIIEKITVELQEAKEKKMDMSSPAIEKFNKILQSHILTDDDWERFKTAFNEVYPNFFATIRFNFPDITNAEIRLAALIRMNLSAKEASSMLGISSESVRKSKYRLKKKLNLNDEESLDNFIKGIT